MITKNDDIVYFFFKCKQTILHYLTMYHLTKTKKEIIKLTSKTSSHSESYKLVAKYTVVRTSKPLPCLYNT